MFQLDTKQFIKNSFVSMEIIRRCLGYAQHCTRIYITCSDEVRFYPRRYVVAAVLTFTALFDARLSYLYYYCNLPSLIFFFSALFY